MRKHALVVCLFILAPSLLSSIPTFAATGKCGTERWAVKTLSDPDAGDVKFSPVVKKTIDELNRLPKRCKPGFDADRFADEKLVYETLGRVFVVKREDDHDFHIGLRDPNHKFQTIVAEVVDPKCPGAKSSPHVAALKKARDEFEDLVANEPFSSLVGQTVRVRGVAFYDRAHRQTGRSDSCLELHPVISMEVVNP